MKNTKSRRDVRTFPKPRAKSAQAGSRVKTFSRSFDDWSRKIGADVVLRKWQRNDDPDDIWLLKKGAAEVVLRAVLEQRPLLLGALFPPQPSRNSSKWKKLMTSFLVGRNGDSLGLSTTVINGQKALPAVAKNGFLAWIWLKKRRANLDRVVDNVGEITPLELEDRLVDLIEAETTT